MEIKEEIVSAVPVNSMGAGGIEGAGVGPNGEPGVNTIVNKKKKLRQIVLRRIPLETLT